VVAHGARRVSPAEWIAKETRGGGRGERRRRRAWRSSRRASSQTGAPTLRSVCQISG
jgi:hypothetical protein